MSNEDYDYTSEPEASMDDMEFGAVAAPDRTADQIEDESGFGEVPVGTHELVVVGFRKDPKYNANDVLVDGQRRSYSAYNIGVILGLAKRPNFTVTDWFTLPPDDPDQMEAYLRGLPEKGKVPGFQANKFYHFMERIGFVPIVTPQGRQLPAEATRLGNWKGRHVVATVDPGKENTNKKKTQAQTRPNPETGLEEEVPAKKRLYNQVRLFSYRVAESTQANYQRPTTTTAPRQKPTSHAAQPTPRPNGNGNGVAADANKAARLADLKRLFNEAIADEDFDRAKEIKAEIAKYEGGAPAPRPTPQPQRQPAMAGAGAGDRGLGNL